MVSRKQKTNAQKLVQLLKTPLSQKIWEKIIIDSLLINCSKDYFQWLWLDIPENHILTATD